MPPCADAIPTPVACGPIEGRQAEHVAPVWSRNSHCDRGSRGWVPLNAPNGIQLFFMLPDNY